jgi:hypothetical protein
MELEEEEPILLDLVSSSLLICYQTIYLCLIISVLAKKRG